MSQETQISDEEMINENEEKEELEEKEEEEEKEVEEEEEEKELEEEEKEDDIPTEDNQNENNGTQEEEVEIEENADVEEEKDEEEPPKKKENEIIKKPGKKTGERKHTIAVRYILESGNCKTKIEYQKVLFNIVKILKNDSKKGIATFCKEFEKKHKTRFGNGKNNNE
jgi:hypothetical protein